MLVGENEQCKITDFGSARDVHEEGFYEKKTKVSYINGFCYSWKIVVDLALASLKRRASKKQNL